MENKKAITAVIRHKGHLGRFALLFLSISLIIMVISCSPAAEADDAEYPPPLNLQIEGFTGSAEDRAVNLFWEAPDTGLTVTHYVVYRNDEELAETDHTGYQDVIGNNDYYFYVTAIYEGRIESEPGNTVNTRKISAEVIAEPPVGPGDSGKDQENGEDAGFNGDGDDADTQDFDWDEVLSGPCANPYYPVAVGISHTYSSSGGTVYSEITNVEQAGFTVTHTSGGSTQIHEWECLPEGLVDFSNPIGDAIQAMGEGGTVVGTTSVTGVTIPSSIEVGDTWSQTYVGTLDVKGQPVSLDFAIDISYNAVAKEEVTVSLGTFQALKVNSTIQSIFTLKGGGVSMPLYTYDATGTSWWVENIGPVKTTGQGSMRGATEHVPLDYEFADTTELIEFNLPSQ